MREGFFPHPQHPQGRGPPIGSALGTIYILNTSVAHRKKYDNHKIIDKNMRIL